MDFTPCKAEQPLWGMELQEKEKNIKIIEENYLERTQGKKRLLTLDLKPFRSHFKEKHPTGKEFQSLGVR